MLKGVYSVLPTPFTPGGEIDVPSLKRVVDLYIRAGVNGLTASGVTSETARLSVTVADTPICLLRGLSSIVNPSLRVKRTTDTDEE